MAGKSVEYSVLVVDTPKDQKHSTLEIYERESQSGEVDEFWGAYLPDGRMFAADISATRDQATAAYRDICKKYPAVH